MMKKIILSLLLILFAQSTAYAEDTNKIAAVVGGEAISTLDVRGRALMIISAANRNANSQVSVEAVMPQALQMLIDERLYSQEAAKLNITVTPAELNNAIAGIEAKNHVKAGGFDQFLEAQNIPADTVKEQIRSQILLVKIINAKVRPKVSVTERELEMEINRLGANNQSLSLKQIFVPLTGLDAAKQDEIKQQLEHIKSKVNGCDSFDTVANAENAALAPTLLSVTSSTLNPAIHDVVSRLNVGETSPVLQTADSIQLLMLCEKGQPAITSGEKLRLSEMLLQRKIELQAKQYIRNLRQETYMEIRM